MNKTQKRYGHMAEKAIIERIPNGPDWRDAHVVINYQTWKRLCPSSLLV